MCHDLFRPGLPGRREGGGQVHLSLAQPTGVLQRKPEIDLRACGPLRVPAGLRAANRLLDVGYAILRVSDLDLDHAQEPERTAKILLAVRD